MIGIKLKMINSIKIKQLSSKAKIWPKSDARESILSDFYFLDNKLYVRK